jgi:hypothetical protein
MCFHLDSVHRTDMGRSLLGPYSCLSHTLGLIYVLEHPCFAVSAPGEFYFRPKTMPRPQRPSSAASPVGPVERCRSGHCCPR